MCVPILICVYKLVTFSSLTQCFTIILETITFLYTVRSILFNFFVCFDSLFWVFNIDYQIWELSDVRHQLKFFLTMQSTILKIDI